MDKTIIIFCTTPDKTCAQEIAQTLVKEKLAACCNIIPGIDSIYSWEGEIQNDKEQLLIIKTLSTRFADIQKTIDALHPYDVPEIIAVDIKKGSKAYLNWISESVGSV